MSFNNRIIKNILQNLNLNERTRLRIVNRQFKDIIDSIQLDEDYLVIFHRKLPIKGRFKFKNELWNLDQCVRVTDLNLFFEQFNRKLISVRTLVIYGQNNGECNYEIFFKELEHLELHNIQFKSSKILQSTKLKSLYLTPDCCFKDNIELKVNKLENASMSSSLFDKFHPIESLFNGFNYQRSSFIRRYDYLELNNEFMIDSNLYKIITLDIEHLKLQTNLSILMSIIGNNKTFRIIDINLIGNLSNYIDDLDRLNTFFMLFNHDLYRLEIRLFGIKIQLSDGSFDFIESMIPFIFIQDGEIGLKIDDKCPLIRRSMCNENSINLKLFLERINWIEFKEDLAEDLIDKMINVKTMLLSFTNRPNLNYDKLFDYFPQLIHIKIQNLKIGISNNLFNSLSSKCLNIQYLKFDCLESINFNFLLMMKNLKCLIFLTYYPIDNNLFVDLIKQLRYLSFIVSQFPVKEHCELKNELRNFKEEVISTAKSKLNSDEFKFLIQLFKQKLANDKIGMVVKYIYERSDYCKNEFKNLDNDINHKELKEIFKIIENKSYQ